MANQSPTGNPAYQPRYRLAAKLLFIALAYFASGRLGLAIPYADSHITLIWLPSGIAVAALMRWGYICWPGIFLGSLATHYSIDSSPLPDISIALGSTLGPLLAVWLLRQLKFHATFDRAYDILLLVVAAAAGMLASAGGGVGSLVIFNVLPVTDVTQAWLFRWLGDFLGVLLAAPLLLNISRAELAKLWAQRVEFLAWCLTMIAMSWGVFFLNNDANGHSQPLAFIVLPIVVWSAMRFGMMGSSLAVLLPVFIAALATSRGLGPFHTEGAQQGLFLLWLFFFTLMLVGLIVAALQAGRKRDEEALRIAATTFETQECIMITDAAPAILRVNQAFQDTTGYSEQEVVGRKPSILKSGRHNAAFYQAMWSALNDTGKWSGEILDRRKNGEIYPGSLTITAVYDHMHRVTHYVAVFSDISQRKKSEQKIHQLAYYDLLTNLPNRQLLLDRLQQAMTASLRSGRYGALMLLDLDRFKTLNDTQGHMLGDQLLVAVAHRLQTCVRDGDSVARLGGDEFVVVLEGLSSEAEEAVTQTGLVAEKIRSELGQPHVLNDLECLSTASIGISLFRGHRESAEDLFMHADVAMYQAKAAGRNAIRFFDPKMQAALDMQTGMEADLRHALEKQQFRLYYQIQVDNLRRPLGAEALLRWEHHERGLVSPAHFIPSAEETGLIVPIGLWVLQTACAKLEAWQHDPLTCDLTLAVNVSSRQFRQPDFVAQVQRILVESGAKPSHLKLELTESTVLENVHDTIAKMREIKMLGVGFSMDDFGTGYSSLQYLKRLPLDQIKIDQSFVRDITSDPNDAAIVSAIIAMTDALGMNVIAEGVETEAQREFLDKHGCHAFQGYLFSKPVPVEQFEGLLREAKGRS